MAVRIAGNTEFAASYTDPVIITFDTSPVSGNLLLAGMADRSGTSVSNFTIADDGSDTGWAELVSHDESLADSTYRTSFKVWWKISDGSEDQITLDDGTSNNKYGFISEYELEGSEEWGDVLGTSSDGVTNSGGSESLSSGNTDSISGDDFLVLSFSAIKTDSKGMHTNPDMDFDDGINDIWDEKPGANHGLAIALADKNDSITGQRSDTANFTSDDNQRTFISMIAVIDLTAAGGTTLPKPNPLNRPFSGGPI